MWAHWCCDKSLRKRNNKLAKEEMKMSQTHFRIHIQLKSGPSAECPPLFLFSPLSHYNLTLASNVQLWQEVLLSPVVCKCLVVANVSSSTNEKPPCPGFGLARTRRSGGLQRELEANAYYITEPSFMTVYVNLRQNKVCRFGEGLQTNIKLRYLYKSAKFSTQ